MTTELREETDRALAVVERGGSDFRSPVARLLRNHDEEVVRLLVTNLVALESSPASRAEDLCALLAVLGVEA